MTVSTMCIMNFHHFNSQLPFFTPPSLTEIILVTTDRSLQHWVFLLTEGGPAILHQTIKIFHDKFFFILGKLIPTLITSRSLGLLSYIVYYFHMFQLKTFEVAYCYFTVHFHQFSGQKEFLIRVTPYGGNIYSFHK